MSTYIQGVTDYIPQVQPFTPNYNFYSGALDFKQGKHDAAANQLSSIYGSLLNAPLTRKDNSETRDKFFKAIEQDIHKMATVDLTKQQNVTAAKGVFNQLISNKALVKDMVWTKNFQNEMQRSEGFKNCIDPDECGGSWWEGGDEFMQFKQMEFANASADDAMRMKNASYVPYQDVTKMAMKMAKEADLNVTIDSDTGKWITSTKNGPLIVKPLQDLFMGSIGKDPKVTQYYKANAYLQRKRFGMSNASQYGSPEAAEQAYADQISGSIESFFGKKEAELRDAKEHVGNKRKGIQDKMAGVIPSKREGYQKVIDAYGAEEEGYANSEQVVKETNGIINVAKTNKRYAPDQIDAVMGQFNLSQDLGSAAQTLAYKDYKQEIKKANPYALEAVKFRNRVLLEKLSAKNAQDLAKQKASLDIYKEQLFTQGGPEANTPTSVTGLKGSTAVGETAETSYDLKTRGYAAFAKDEGDLRKGISGGEKMIVNEIVHRTAAQAELGGAAGAQAREDYVNMANKYIAARGSSKEQIGVSATSEMVTSGRRGDVPESGKYSEKADPEFEALAKRMQGATTMNEKYAIAKEMGMDLEKISGAQVDNFYEGTVYPLFNQKDEKNQIARDYLKPTWIKGQGLMQDIATKGEWLKQYHKQYASDAKDAVVRAKLDGDYDDFTKSAFDSYINKDGHAVDEKTFVKNMVAKGQDAAKAQEYYRGDRQKGFFEGNTWQDIKNVAQFGIANAWEGLTGVIGASPIGGLYPTIAANLIDDDDDIDMWGWDFNSPSDVANWNALGADVENDGGGFGSAGIHDEWKRMYTQYAKVNKNSLFGITGAGDFAAVGQNFSSVDPARYRSTGTQGTTGFLKNGVAAPSAVFSLGGFEGSIPDDDPIARKIGQQTLSDLQSQFKGKTRPMLNVTYVNIAGGDAGKVGLNIKYNQEYLNAHDGTKKEPTDFANPKLASEGLTVYMDKASADNLFTDAYSKTSLERMMDWTNEVEMNSHPDYIKDFKLAQTPDGYMASGTVRTGLDKNGNEMWEHYQRMHALNSNVNDMYNKYTDLFSNIASQNKTIDVNELHKKAQ